MTTIKCLIKFMSIAIITVGIALFVITSGAIHITHNCSGSEDPNCVVTTVHSEYWFQELDLVEFISFYLAISISICMIILVIVYFADKCRED